MYKILLVDDVPNNSKLLEFYIKEYFKEKEIEFSELQFLFASDGYEGLKQVLEHKDIDLIFLDIMMPKVTGIEMLELVRLSNLYKVPKIIVLTGIHDNHLKDIAKKQRANAYITKPIRADSIKIMLDQYVNITLLQKKENEFEFEFDDECEISQEKQEILEEFNKTHIALSALEFLEDVENLDYLIEETNYIEEDINLIIDNLAVDNLESYIEPIVESINKYASILNGFESFYYLSVALRNLSTILVQIDCEIIPSQKMELVIVIIQAILEDLASWREHVFIKKDAIDVHYSNASLINNCMQLKELVR
jgi:CheY-like chemotaxis protein